MHELPPIITAMKYPITCTGGIRYRNAMMVYGNASKEVTVSPNVDTFKSGDSTREQPSFFELSVYLCPPARVERVLG